MAEDEIEIEAAGRAVRISHPDKVWFPDAGITKLDVVHYYEQVMDGALRGVFDRPMILRRYVHGATEKPFFQKRAPDGRPEWIDTVVVSFPSGRTAEHVVVRDAAALLWCVNLGCMDLNPHPIRSGDLWHPDELRIDLDPGPGVGWSDVRDVALAARDVLAEHGLVGWPKTSGSRGIHVLVRVAPEWKFDQVRRCALAVAREVEKRLPGKATSKWWKEERQGVFLDYNQNARDRTVASAYSVRPVPDARVSAPLGWDEVATVQAESFTLRTMPQRFAERGDLHAGIDAAVGDLTSLLALVARHEEEGLGDAAWPPQYAKQEGEPPRVAPSKAKKPGSKPKSGGRRQPKVPFVIVAQSPDEAAARDGLRRWKERHPDATKHLVESDVLVDAMRGSSSTWTRIRVKLGNVPEADRPPEEPPDPDDDPTRAWRESFRKGEPTE